MHLKTTYHGYEIHIDWEITQRCNYACSYCASYNNELPFQFKKLDEYEDSIKFLRSRIGNKKAKINLLGGEPTLYKDWVDLVDILVKYNFIPTITTNLSVPVEKYIDKLEHKKVIMPSFHPQFADADVFIQSVIRLREKDLIKNVSIMADTSYWDIVTKVYDALSDIAMINKLREEFKSEFEISSGFIEYSKEQEDKIRESIKSHEDYDIYLGDKLVTLGQLKSDFNLNFKGWKCTIGQERFSIMPNGDIFPSACFLNYRMAKIGNLFRKKLKVLNKPVVCPFNHCSCGPDIRIEKWT